MENHTDQSQPGRFGRLRTQAQKAVLGRPFTSFILALVALLALIGIANTINKPQETTKKTEKPLKEVSVFTIGTSPKITAQATIRKSGTISIYAQTAGVVQKVYKKEGDNVSKGTNLVWISNNYAGGTASSLQRQLAQKNYESTRNNYSLNVDTVSKQRELAELNRDNTEELRKISEKSAQETNDLINLNQELLRTVDTGLQQLASNPAPTATESAQINQLKGQQAQLSASINQLRSGERGASYQANPSNPPTSLADAQRDLTLKQLELQERGLLLQLEVSKLNYQIAQVSEGLNYPASPVAGKVERINVTIGQTVAPGDLIAVVTTGESSAIADAFVSSQTAQRIAKLDPSFLYIGKNTVEVTPAYVSTQPTNGQLYSITYQIPEESVSAVTNQSYIKVEIPVGAPDTTASTPFIPVDAVYQTQDGAFVYLVEKKDNRAIAKGRKIELGTITGSFVEVTNGLTKEDQVITDRNILEGDSVKVN